MYEKVGEGKFLLGDGKYKRAQPRVMPQAVPLSAARRAQTHKDPVHGGIPGL